MGRFLLRDGLVDACAAPVEPWQRGRLNEEPRHLPGQLRHAEGCQGHKNCGQTSERLRIIVEKLSQTRINCPDKSRCTETDFVDHKRNWVCPKKISKVYNLFLVG